MNKNTHLNQAIHEEQEAIIELRVQLRLLQTQKLQQEQGPPAVQQPQLTQAAQPSPEARADESAKRPATQLAAADSPAAAKEAPKPSPSKERWETDLTADNRQTDLLLCSVVHPSAVGQSQVD
ncbi:ralA-binding protein 1-like [Arapaima gigas]